MNHYVIGAGGVGSWLLPVLVKLAGRNNPITIVDGDTLEEKNLDRQLFSEEDIGSSKAGALAKRYGGGSGGPGRIYPHARWYSCGAFEHDPSDILFVCVDNHPARRDALAACDLYGCRAIIAANETHSAEAFIYLPQWQGTRLDPRNYYPEIETDRSDDPRSAAIGCTGHAQEARPQLVTANFTAADLALRLYVAWVMELPKLDPTDDPAQHFPHRLDATLTRLNSHKTGQL